MSHLSRRRPAITDEQKAARAEKARQAKAEAARRRSLAVEQAQLDEIASVWDRIPDETQRVLNYIRLEIPKRSDPSDVAFLRETRAIHFRPFRKLMPKEDTP